MPALSALPELIGFFSYSREDDEDFDSALSRLRTRIQNELRGQLGRSREALRLWQDKEAIAPGTLWAAQIQTAIDQSVFFIPIISPRVVHSKYCGVEFEKFLDRERELKRDDLVFPILFIDVPELSDEAVWDEHPILRLIGQRQYVDWRDFRYDPDNAAVKREIASFCGKIAATLRRVPPAEYKVAQAQAPRVREAERPQPTAPVAAKAKDPPAEAPSYARAEEGQAAEPPATERMPAVDRDAKAPPAAGEAVAQTPTTPQPKAPRKASAPKNRSANRSTETASPAPGPPASTLRTVALPWLPVATPKQAKEMTLAAAVCLAVIAALGIFGGIGIALSGRAHDVGGVAATFILVGIAFALCAAGTYRGVRIAALIGAAPIVGIFLIALLFAPMPFLARIVAVVIFGIPSLLTVAGVRAAFAIARWNAGPPVIR